MLTRLFLFMHFYALHKLRKGSAPFSLLLTQVERGEFSAVHVDGSESYCQMECATLVSTEWMSRFVKTFFPHLQSRAA